MITGIMSVIFTGINQCWLWVCELWSAVGLSFPVVSLAVLTASIAVRFLLLPVIGAGAQLPKVDLPAQKSERQIGFTSKW